MEKIKYGLADLTKENALAFAKLFEKLFNEGRYKEMAGYYTAEATLIGMKLPVFKRRESIEKFWKKTYERTRRIKFRRSIEVLDVRTGHDLGFISGVVRVEIRILFLKIEKVFRYVTIWTKDADLWQLVIDISTQVKTERNNG